MNQQVLTDLNIKPFMPLKTFRGGMFQTVAGVYWPQLPDLPATGMHRVALPDGDSLVLMENSPARDAPGSRIVLLAHGLTGCYRSNYMVRLCRKFTAAGLRVMRLNLRGCGPGFGLARLPYHSGRSDDLREALCFISRLYPDAPVTLAGFSLSGNVALKMAGEDADSPTGCLDSLVAVSPPVDLEASSRKTASHGKVFDQYFVGRLKKDVEKLHTKFPDLGVMKFPAKMTLRDFDEMYTAPRSGFRDAADYYSRCSSARFVHHIAVPALVLCAMDDPVVEGNSFTDCRFSGQCDLVLTNQGGHVGFLGSAAKPWSFRWMDDLIIRWVMNKTSRQPP